MVTCTMTWRSQICCTEQLYWNYHDLKITSWEKVWRSVAGLQHRQVCGVDASHPIQMMEMIMMELVKFPESQIKLGLRKALILVSLVIWEYLTWKNPAPSKERPFRQQKRFSLSLFVILSRRIWEMKKYLLYNWPGKLLKSPKSYL